jgi:aspartate carbamoyltransferase
MPKDYIEKMKQAGFEIDNFESLNDYLTQKDKGLIAPIFYFTRLQKERMDEETQKKATQFEKQLSISEDNINMVPDYTKFYHPLPRDKNCIIIPRFLDKTPFNRYDEQSQNGYFTRIALLSMLLGDFDKELIGRRKKEQVCIDDFVNEANILPKTSNKPEYKKAIRPIENGIVIDHIAKGVEPSKIWEMVIRIRKSLKLDLMGSQGVFTSTPIDGIDYYKGIISIPDYKISGTEDNFVRKLSAISPNCTLNIIRDSKIQKKYRLGLPQIVVGFEGTSCKNPNCISYLAHNEGVTPSFHRYDTNGAKQFVCDYCGHPHEYSDIFDAK